MRNNSKKEYIKEIMGQRNKQQQKVDPPLLQGSSLSMGSGNITTGRRQGGHREATGRPQIGDTERLLCTGVRLHVIFHIIERGLQNKHSLVK